LRRMYKEMEEFNKAKKNLLITLVDELPKNFGVRKINLPDYYKYCYVIVLFGKRFQIKKYVDNRKSLL